MGEAIILRVLDSDKIEVSQETGQSITCVMSQKAVTDALNTKVDKVEGKGLSTNDFTTEDKEKLYSSVPQTRTINSKQLTADITLTCDDIGALPTSFTNHTHSTDNITSGQLPVWRGGTGADTVDGARNNLNVYSKSEVDNKTSATTIGNIVYPVGSIYMSVNGTNPQYLFGGTWVHWAAGRIPVSVNFDDGDFNYVERAGGWKTHSHLLDGTGAAMIGSDEAAANTLAYSATNVGVKTGTIYTVTGTNAPPKSQRAHNTGLTGWTNDATILPPYMTCYMWKRIG